MKNKRQKQIMDMLQEDGSVTISGLLEKFQVSIETIRRDLGELERGGLLKKTYGGAMLTSSNPIGITEVADWRERQGLAGREKDLIAQRAAELIPDGCVVAMEVGTTMFALAKHLVARKNLTILTNDLFVAQTLCQNQAGRVFLVGGHMGASYYTSGELSQGFLDNFAAIDIFLVSTEGLTVADGLTTPNSEVNALKKIYIQKAGRTIGLCDYTKFGRRAIFRTCALKQLDLLITDSKAPAATVQKIKELGVQVDVVSGD